MISERQKYVSAFFKTFGYAFFAPFGSILFQWIVLKQDLISGRFYIALIAFVVGWLFIAYGYIMLKEN